MFLFLTSIIFNFLCNIINVDQFKCYNKGCNIIHVDQFKGCKTFSVARDTSEWNRLEQRVRETMQDARNCKILHIQNKWLWDRFAVHKKRMTASRKFYSTCPHWIQLRLCTKSKILNVTADATRILCGWRDTI